MFIKLHEYNTGNPIIIMCNRISVIRTKALWNFSECLTKIDEIAKPEYITNIILNDCYYPDKGSKRKIEIYDTTLRDGAQSEGINYSVSDKIKIIEKLDNL